MKPTARHAVVLVTAPNLKAARGLAQLALENRLVACANIIPRIESHYWWQEKIESSPEVLILFKTARSHLRKFERLVVENHPYDTPEFVVLPLIGGNSRYLAWLSGSLS